MKDDATLLHEYARRGSEADFSELVRRHIDFVYGVALRQVNGDAHLAEDATQLVFSDLARKADRLANHRLLTGWLFKSARYASANLVRTSRRRLAREQAALPEQIINASEPEHEFDWERVRPILDGALEELSERDREILLLRFLKNRDYHAIGALLALSDSAARMCVNRALVKLHAVLARRGVTSTAAALAVALESHAVVTVPLGLATTIAGNSIAATGVPSGFLTVASLTKIQLVVASALLIAGLSTAVLFERERQDLLRELAVVPPVQASASADLRQSIRELTAAAQAAEMLQVDDAEWARLRKGALSSQAQVEGKALEGSHTTPYRPVQIDKLPTWF